MDTKKVDVADAARRGARGRGSLNFVIISAMGLAAATALTGAAAAVGAAPSGSDGRAMNSFVVVEGEGVRVADDGSVHFPNAKSPVSVEVTARPGWKVNGRKSLSLTRAPGEGGTLRVTSDLGEDSEHVPLEDCHFEPLVSKRHAPPGIRANAPGRLVLMYALPESNILVSASATCEVLSNGLHGVTTTWLPCSVCQSVHDPVEENSDVTIEPGERFWTAFGAGVATNSNVWSGYMAKGTGQAISFSVVATNECPECVCSAATNVVVDVHELSVQREDYIGLDRTDAGRANPRANAKTATAQISPGPSGTVTCSWTDCGICSFIEPTDQQSVQYFAPNPDTASGSYLDEKLKVTATIVDGDQTASATCTTNFTVVKVDVEIGGVDENIEESEGAFVQFVPDDFDADANAILSAEGMRKMVTVAFTCEPKLPPDDEVEVSCSGSGELYEKLADGCLVKVESASYPACEIGKRVFMLHGHEPSWEMRDGEIMITHKRSGARDLAKYTDFSIMLVTPGGDPVAAPVDSGDGQNEFTYSEAWPGVLTMNLKARVSPAGFAARIKKACMFSVGSIGNSTMAWDSSNPGGAPTLSGDYLCATVTFTGLPANNSDFGKKEASISYSGEVADRNDYEVFFPKIGKNHPECSTCPGCSNWFYYWREGDVCSIPKDALWSVAEGEHKHTMGWHSNGTIYLTDKAAEENDETEKLTARFSNPTYEFKIKMEEGRILVDVSDKSHGEKGIAYSVESEPKETDPEDHTIDGIGGDGKGIGCAAQTAVHELGHKAYRQACDAANSQYKSYSDSVDKIAEEFGYDSIEYAYAELKFRTWKWIYYDDDFDLVMDSEERNGGNFGIVSDMGNRDTYNFASVSGGSCYSQYGDEEIRMRALEPNAVYNVGLDWSNPGCQYSSNPYGPKK